MSNYTVLKEEFPAVLMREVLWHPFELVGFLIQVGVEPQPPVLRKSLLGKEYLALPSSFGYMKYIYNLEGLYGLYRGFFPHLSCRLIRHGVYRCVTVKLCQDIDEEEEENLEDEEEAKKVYVREMLIDIAAITTSIIVSQPLKVIANRSMAQFLGKETRYTGIVSSCQYIFTKEGVMGFFVGIVPLMIGEVLCALVIHTMKFATRKMVTEKRAEMIVDKACDEVGRLATYPFEVVANNMSILNSGVAAGALPHMQLYDNWITCWKYLYRTKQIKRGPSFFYRKYIPNEEPLEPKVLHDVNLLTELKL